MTFMSCNFIRRTVVYSQPLLPTRVRLVPIKQSDQLFVDHLPNIANALSILANVFSFPITSSK